VTEQPIDLRERARGAIANQPQRTVTVLSCLLAVEDALGFIPPEAVDEVATRTATTVNDVWAVASFYTNFRFDPPGRHVVEVCWGPTCHLSGAQAILERVQQTLGMEGEGDTPDGQVTLKYNTCVGACSQAPVVMVDHRPVGRVTPEAAATLVAEVAAESS
jgi:NADH:ubiquinone oxidoreductase subunit E